MPFILRGVRLLGINSGESSNDVREAVWRRLASDLKPPLLKEMARTVPFSQLPAVFDDFINARVTPPGRRRPGRVSRVPTVDRPAETRAGGR